MNLPEKVFNKAIGTLRGVKKSIFCKYLTDTHIVGYPKSGNTWVRFFLANYIAEVKNIKLDLEFDRTYTHQISGAHIYMSHLGGMHYNQSRAMSELDFDVIVKRAMGEMRRRPIAFLTRDPRDVIVSFYFHSRKYRPAESVSSFIRDEKIGIGQTIDYMNMWYASRSTFSDFSIFTYEDRRSHPVEEFTRLLQFLKWPIDKELIERVVVLSDFDSMKTIEKNQTIDHKTFQYGEASAPESLRMRKGKVGGYMDHASDDDIHFMNEEIKRLNHVFQYQVK
ncbi:sulfotransferase domain-containing protein [Candidatus Pacebacteria bacterium]|nr:sulfotransferase domain-containing protein [Candidatus Paceibacterota bacterium]